MSANNDEPQRIDRLRPYSEVLTWIRESVSPVELIHADPAAVVGATFASDIVAGGDHPPSAVALSDGWAVASEELADASSYSPTIPKTAPAWVNVGQALPVGADAVVNVDTLAKADNNFEAYAPATYGEGVLPKGANASKGLPLCRAGQRIRSLHTAALRNLGFESIPVRCPKILIVGLSVANSEEDFIGTLIAQALRADGARSEIKHTSDLADAISDSSFDATITIGQTGTGSGDQAVKSLKRLDALAYHGIGITPGQTAALGVVAGRPLLMLPGRLDAAISVYLTVGRKLVQALAGTLDPDHVLKGQLTKKVSSPIGLAEVVLVRVLPEGVVPLGSGFFASQQLMQADGWIFVPETSEGFQVGANVDVRMLP